MSKHNILGKILLVIFLLKSVLAVAVENDSLLSLIENDNREIRLEALVKLGSQLSASMPTESEKYSRQAVSIASEIGDNKLLADALSNLGDALYYQNKRDSSNQCFEKALKIRESLGDTKGTGILYNYIGISHYEAGNYDLAMKSYEKAKACFTEAEDMQMLASVLGNMAVIYKSWGKNDKALDLHSKSLEIYIEVSDENGIAGAYNNIGSIYKNRGQYQTALEYYQNSVEKYKISGNSRGLANTYNKLGILYFEWENLEKSVAFYELALELEEKNGNKQGIAHISTNLGLIFKQKGNKNTAIQHFQKVKEIFTEVGDSKGIANTLSNIGQVYLEVGEFKMAIPVLEEALSIESRLNESKGKSVAYLFLGKAYTFSGEFEKAHVALDSSLLLAQKSDLSEQIRENYLARSNLYNSTGKPELALEFYKKHIALKDSVFRLEKHQQITEMQARYETAQKEQEIDLLKKDQELQESRIFKDRIYLILSAGGIVVLIFLLLLLVNRNRIRTRANQELAIQNEQIQQQKEEIKTQADQLLKTNRELEKLSIVARETDNAIIITDSNALIEWVNPGFKKLYGLDYQSWHEVAGKKLGEVRNNNDISIAVEECIEKKRTIDTIYQIQNSTDNRWFQTTITPILDEDNRVYKLICIDSEITKIKKAEEEVNQRRKDIEKAFKKSSRQQLQLLIAFEKINDQQSEIKDSIEYAHRLQMAVMPSSNCLGRFFTDHFIMYKPRDIVSGDFYWMRDVSLNDSQVLVTAVVDCTGHGVPGAFMSMLGIAFLNEILSSFHSATSNENFKADIILNLLRDKVIQALNQGGDENEADDGMDIALCIYTKKTGRIQYAGAHNPLYLISKNIPSVVPDESIKRTLEKEGLEQKLYEIVPDKMPIGIHILMNPKPFSVKEIFVQKGDKIYIFSDGYADQFGGMHGKKIKTSTMKDILLATSEMSMKDQNEALEANLAEWRNFKDQYSGEIYPQIDDITIMGMEI